MKIVLCGQAAFGAAVYEALSGVGLRPVLVVSPRLHHRGERRDPLTSAAERGGSRWQDADAFSSRDVSPGTGLIVAAHSHSFISKQARAAARYGAVGYHPSLLPIHRGRDAVAWTVRARDRVAGGSVYWLSDNVDSGPLAAQEHVLVRPDDTASELWRRDLFPLGVRLLVSVVRDVQAGRIVRVPQLEECATWEPSIGRPPLRRPELPALPAPGQPRELTEVEFESLHSRG